MTLHRNAKLGRPFRACADDRQRDEPEGRRGEEEWLPLGCVAQVERGLSLVGT